jgi:uncharacterized repeat protein (TIGR01451 family)
MKQHEIRNKTPAGGVAARSRSDNQNQMIRKENLMNFQNRIFTVARYGLGIMMIVAAVAMTPGASEANTASNTLIRNTATVSYRDSGGTLQAPVSAQADVTVTLVASAPNLTAPTDQSTAPGTPVTYNYTITATANGPDTYNLTRAITESAGITPGTSTAVISVPSVLLGASTFASPATIAAVGNTPITVPNDVAAGGGVNGIVAGDTVVIAGATYTVASVTDNGGLGIPGTSIITVTGNGTASALLPYGTLIAEQQTLSVLVTPGTVTATTNQSVTVNLTATSVADGTKTTTDQTITTVLVANLSVVKEVSKDGSSWSVATTAAPNTLLYYRITVTNNGGANATSVVITDPLTTYTAYEVGSGKRATGAATSYALAPTTLTDTNGDGDGYDWNLTTAGTVTYTVGTLANGAANAAQLFFQARVR